MKNNDKNADRASEDFAEYGQRQVKAPDPLSQFVPKPNSRIKKIYTEAEREKRGGIPLPSETEWALELERKAEQREQAAKP